MVKFALVLAALATSASAFAPASVSNVKTDLNAFAGGMVGGESVEPMPFRPGPTKTAADFDPCGFTEVWRVIIVVVATDDILWMYKSHVVLLFLYCCCSVLPSGFPGSVSPN